MGYRLAPCIHLILSAAKDLASITPRVVAVCWWWSRSLALLGMRTGLPSPIAHSP